MLTLYVVPDCTSCATLRDALDDLAVSHETIEVSNPSELPASLGHDHTLPLLVDKDDLIEGTRAVLDYLETFEEFREQWYKFQSDACYCDEQGHVL